MRAIVLCVLALCVPLPAFAVMSVTDSVTGETINFQDDETCGTFISGSNWCVGPVTVTSRTNQDTSSAGFWLHGCQQDPTPVVDWVSSAPSSNSLQGFDERMPNNNYNAARNLCDSYPFTVTAGHTIVFAISNPSGPDAKGIGTVLSYTLLTVLSGSPAANSFRPPWTGTDKTVSWTLSSINFDRLLDLSSASYVTGLPSFATKTAHMKGEYVVWVGQPNPFQNLTAINGSFGTAGGGYGADFAWSIDQALMLIHSNQSDATKQDLVVQVIQKGIDIYGLRVNGMVWMGMGGFSWPEQMLLITAASLLNSQAMMDVASCVASPVFANCREYKYVSQNDINTPRTCPTNDPNRPCDPYAQPQLGMPEWCSAWLSPADSPPSACSSNISAVYRPMSGMHQMVPAVIMYLTGLMTEHGNPAFFSYMLNTPSPTRVNQSGGAQRFWETYGNPGSGSWNPPSCNASQARGNDFFVAECYWRNNFLSETPIDGSVSIGSEPEQPIVTISSPTTGTETTSATTSMSGTASSGAGVSSIACPNSGTPTGTTSWSCATVGLTTNTVNSLQVTATGGDGGVGSNAVSVLRMTVPSTNTFDFTLNAGGGATAAWPNLPTTAFTDQGTGNVIKWQNNRAEGSGTFGRHFAFWNSSITNFGDDQAAEVTILSTPATNNFGYAVVQAQGTTPSTYDNCSCTAEVGVSKCAQITNGTRVQLGADISTTWTTGDRLRVEMTNSTDTLEVFKNDVSLATRTGCTLTGGQPGIGAWGTFAVDNFAAFNVSNPGDQEGPVVAFVVPTSAATYAAPENTASVAIAGTASDATAVTACTYLAVQSGSTGATTGTTPTWSATVSVVVGPNDISVSCTDSVSGNPMGVANLLVTVPNPNPQEEVSSTRIRISRIR